MSTSDSMSSPSSSSSSPASGRIRVRTQIGLSDFRLISESDRFEYYFEATRSINFKQDLKNLESIQEIEQDVLRTMRHVSIFEQENSPAQRCLSKVLHNLHTFQPYVQGTSFLTAALILSHSKKNEETSIDSNVFCLLRSLMEDFGLRELWKPGFFVLRVRLYQLDRLIEQKLPDVHKKLSTMHLTSADFATQWFLTLFSKSHPDTLFLEVLNLLIAKGWKGVFRCFLVVLHTASTRILSLKDDAVEQLATLFISPEIASLNVETLYSTIRVRNRDLRQLEQEYFTAEPSSSWKECLQIEMEELHTAKKRVNEQLLCQTLRQDDKLILKQKLAYVEEELSRKTEAFQELKEFSVVAK